jgi:murein DD-endopeptidase MepM/ murein hydrolase activator NlpD
VTIRSRPLLSVLVASALLAGALAAEPAHADTETDLDAAKQELAGLRAELDRINRLWLDAEAAVSRSQDKAELATARIGALEDELSRIQVRLNERAASLFVAGGSPQIVAVLTSDSVTDAADRLEFASAVAQGDTDLATRVTSQTQELAWQREQLAEAIQEQQQAQAALQSQEEAINARLADYEARVQELEDQLAAEQAPPPSTDAPGGDTGSGPGDPGGGSSPPITGSGWLLTCPVAGPNSFVDSFGDPRPGGRTHQGIDLIAAQNTPVVATHSGTVHRTGSSIGGLGVVLSHDGSADWTFYTHFDHYGAYGEGQHVGAGQVIGYVGNTGTTVYHLHFEYHPNGGVAVNPYSALLGVC